EIDRRDQDGGDRGEGGVQHEGDRHQARHVDAEHGGQRPVLGDRLHRPTQFGPGDEELQRADDDRREQDVPDLLQRDDDGPETDRVPGEDGRERQGEWRPELLQRVPDEQAEPDGGDDQGEHAHLEEPRDQELLDAHPEQERRDEDGGQHGEREREPEHHEEQHHRERRQHDELALRKVDRVRRLPEQHEADGGHGVDGADGHTGHAELDEIRHDAGARARRYLQGRTLYGPPSMPTVLATTDFWSLTSTVKLGRSRLPFSFTYTSMRRPGSSLVVNRLLCRQARTLAWSQLPTRCTAAFSMCTPMYPLNALWSGTRLYF